ncbi:uncharacterized protein LOC143223791 isoform X2 [Tachypleus tridentatus]|uniref:uncharacterized protein LOC143223791 isoform X2 n=1 Tax=Tachypleus tridentatus TaxID=6853 RepID=UPI003FD4A2C4
MSSKQTSSSDVCDVLAQFLSKELQDKCLSENEKSEEETSNTLCSSEDEKLVRYVKSRKRKKHKKHKSKRKKQDSGKEKNQLKKTRYENYDSEKVKSKVSKEELLKQNDQKIYPQMKNQVVLKSSNISENSVPKDDYKCKNESEFTYIQIPLTKMKCIEDFNSLVPVKSLVKPSKECEVDNSTVCDNEIIENSSLESKQEVCDHVKMTEFGTLQDEDREESFSCSKIKEQILDNIKKINSLNDKSSDDCVKLNQNNLNLLQNSDSKTVNQDTVSRLGTKNDISQQLKSACQSNRCSYTTVHEVLTSFHTQYISFVEERTVRGVSNMGCDRNINNIYLQPKNNEDSLNTKETDEILHESKGTFSEKGTFQKNSNENVQECADKSGSDNQNLNPELVHYTEKNSSLNNLPDMSVGEVDKETPLINQLTSLSSKNVHKPTATEDEGNDMNTFQPQFLNIVSHKKNLSKSKILIKDLKCSMTLQKVGQDSQKKLELLEEGEITSEEEVEGNDNKSEESFGEFNSDEGSGEVSSTDEEKKRKRKKKKKHKYKKEKKRTTGREKIRNRHCRKSRSHSPPSYSRRSGSRFSTEENRKFDSRKSRSPSPPSYSPKRFTFFHRRESKV